jgi:hypothetical protein
MKLFEVEARLVKVVVWHMGWKKPQLCISMSPRTLKLNEEKSKDVPLGKEHGFAPAYMHSLLRLVNGIAKVCTCQIGV